MSDKHGRRTHRLKAATVWALLVIGVVGTALQAWWWYTDYLDPLEFFIVPPAALGAAFLLEMRWGLMLDSDENSNDPQRGQTRQ